MHLRCLFKTNIVTFNIHTLTHNYNYLGKYDKWIRRCLEKTTTNSLFTKIDEYCSPDDNGAALPVTHLKHNTDGFTCVNPSQEDGFKCTSCSSN